MPSQTTQVNEGDFFSVKVSGFPSIRVACFRVFNIWVFWQFNEPNIQASLDGFAEMRYQQQASSIDGKTDNPGYPEALGREFEFYNRWHGHQQCN